MTAPQVERVKLGPTDMEISPLGVGCWAWGDKMYWKYEDTDEANTALKEAFDKTLAAGINMPARTVVFTETRKFDGAPPRASQRSGAFRLARPRRRWISVASKGRLL